MSSLTAQLTFQHGPPRTPSPSFPTRSQAVQANSSSGSSIAPLTRTSNVVFQRSSLETWSYWNSLSVNSSWSDFSTAASRSLSRANSRWPANEGSRSAYLSMARRAATASPVARWQMPALRK
ncbi:hypothetical protein HYQ46_008743 [Verticillium longisporum]|nr:hypothetical protein HYQ46_008743 [Verticillium longisporum]